MRKRDRVNNCVKKRPITHVWAAVILLVSSGFSPANGSLVADPRTIFLVGLTVAGMFACEYSLRGRCRRPALPVVGGHSRN
jgi:hypothetical protein